MSLFFLILRPMQINIHSSFASSHCRLALGHYVPHKNCPAGVKYYKSNIFVTVPRWKSGVPSTLNLVSVDEFCYVIK